MNRSVSCWQCGADLPDPDARYCPACGAALARPGFWEEFLRRRGWLWVLLGIAVVAAVALIVTRVLPGRGGQPIVPTPLAGAETGATQQVASGQPTAGLPGQATGQALTPGASATSTLAPTVTPSPAATSTAEPTPTMDLDAALLEAANRFQEAKAYSQATGDTSRLGEALAGDALQRQIELVNQWKDQGCSWEITLDEPLTVRVLETRDDAWARIEVSKVETRILHCEGQPDNVTSGDAYTTAYVVELIDGRWLVTQRE